MDVLVEYVGGRYAVVAGRCVGVTMTAAMPEGAKCSRNTAFIDLDALPLSEGSGESYAAFPGDSRRQPNPYEEVWA